MNNDYILYYDSPVGLLKCKSDEQKLKEVQFVEEKKEPQSSQIPLILKETSKQLDEYFKGTRKQFHLNLHLQGTEFQEKVWNELTNIPFGELASYKKVGEKIGNEKAMRAVGNANNKNKIVIIIPCHRVVGSNGKLVGYGGGMWRKEWLLQHENTNVSSDRL
ncbi:methylated-DNA--[protein]-cysteine S-methyltransferase [Chengkuizengella axinellae]|uniref:Methylated-DNA--protein-cysteine methyltransferase n=1 Tax=Chengkuizengella axinellae TaxID=3064388 RepID=A0ABT9J6E0_9BACL|nr:methylated-DNA--[protein]-cysteine S-methyltransferase [Chengkuizengella sp. 2205SS18-9]MDP5276524.1 methylated-DNA--[protein]-cysteine S-methyltransferase [Chengkuizengella sp. 2205SS18-9]